MIYDLQKANFLKRLSAYILDLILLIIVATGVAWITSTIVDFSGHVEIIEAKKTEYEQAHGVDFDISEQDFLKLTVEEQQKITHVHDELFAKDQTVLKEYNLIYSFMLLITSISLFVAHLVTEFIIPLILKNGQTVGKKIFGIAVMHTNSVRIKHLTLFVRSILGKYTIETMIPVLIAIMIFFGMTGIVGTMVLLGIFVLQVVLLCVTKNGSCLHDLLSNTVTVDMASQMIFDTEEQMIEYVNEQHKKKVEKSPY